MTDLVGKIVVALEAGQTVAVATVVKATSAPNMLGRKLLVQSDGTIVGSLGSPLFDARVVMDCRVMASRPSSPQMIAYVLAADESAAMGVLPETELHIFLEVARPPETLLIVGAGHIAQPLSRLGKMLGFEVAVIDNRWSFANRARFPEADRVIAGPFDQEVARFPITPATYIVLITRGHFYDEEALRQVIGSAATYIGMIGSRRRVSTVLRHMVESGISRDEVERVCSPIGIDIGAETPEEIAVSILAEVINLRRRGTRHPSSMSNKKFSPREG